MARKKKTIEEKWEPKFSVGEEVYVVIFGRPYIRKGTIEKINALEFGKLSLRLGAGKENIDDKIDYTVGIKLNKLVGDKVKKGDILATIYYKKKVPEISFDNIYKIS